MISCSCLRAPNYTEQGVQDQMCQKRSISLKGSAFHEIGKAKMQGQTADFANKM